MGFLGSSPGKGWTRGWTLASLWDFAESCGLCGFGDGEQRRNPGGFRGSSSIPIPDSLSISSSGWVRARRGSCRQTHPIKSASGQSFDAFAPPWCLWNSISASFSDPSPLRGRAPLPELRELLSDIHSVCSLLIFLFFWSGIKGRKRRKKCLSLEGEDAQAVIVLEDFNIL